MACSLVVLAGCKKYLDQQPITEERIKRALVAVARIIEDGSLEYMPILDALERHLDEYKKGRDPLSRARAILKAHETTP